MELWNVFFGLLLVASADGYVSSFSISNSQGLLRTRALGDHRSGARRAALGPVVGK